MRYRARIYQNDGVSHIYSALNIVRVRKAGKLVTAVELVTVVKQKATLI